MVINIKKYLLLVISLFLFTSFLSAQTSGYFIEEKGDEVKYVQRFVWKGGENTLYYEVVFEREVDGEYIPYLKQTTKAKFIEVSLHPGPYRFRVIPYDILGRPTEGSQWVNIHVFAVTQPNQYREPEPETKTNTKTNTNTALNSKPGLEPESEEEEEEPVKSEKEKTIFFRLGAMGGFRKPIYGNEYFGDSGDPYIGLRTSIVFKTPLDIYIGPELLGDVNRYGNIENWKFYFYTVGLNILAEKWSSNKIFGVGFKIGALYPTIDIQKNWHEMSYEQMQYFKNDNMDVYAVDEGFNTYRLVPSIGASLYFLIKKHLLLELGFDYLHVRSTASDSPASGFFCPKFGISYQF